MLPFVVGGGILIALAFLIDGLCVDMNALAKADRANFGTITPVAAQLKTIGGLAFGLMLPVLAGYIGVSNRRQTGTCGWICRWSYRSKRKIRIPRSAGSWFLCPDI